MAKHVRKKPCEEGEHMCLFQLGRGLCLAFPGKGTYAADGSPTVRFRRIEDVPYEVCMEDLVPERGGNWEKIGEMTGWFTPDTDHAGRIETLLPETVKKIAGVSGSQLKVKDVVISNRKGKTITDDGTHRVTQNRDTGEVQFIETSLFAEEE